METSIRQASLIARATAGAALCLFACAGLAQATPPAGAGIRFSGFGTLGLMHADAPAGWGFMRDLSQPAHGGGTRADIDTRLGLQLNYAPSPQVEFVGQVIATRRLPTVKRSDAIEWGFAAYRPSAEVTLRLGRVNVDQFLMTDYRNVGFGYLYARPPVDFYSALPTALDGVDIDRTWTVDGTQWRTKLNAGSTYSSDVKIGPLVGIMVAREADGLLLRASLTRTRVAYSPSQLRPLLDGLAGLGQLPLPSVVAEAQALRSQLDLSDARITYASVGMNYEQQNWQWTAEWMRSKGHPALGFQAGYVGVGRRFGPATVYGIASRIRTMQPAVETPAWGATLEPVFGADFAQQAQLLGSSAAFAANVQGARQSTMSLGARWDIGPRLALKAQWDRVRISANGSLLWSRSTRDAGRANVGSVVLDFVF